MHAIRVLVSAVRHRRLLAELVRRDVRGRYVGSRFGLLWSVLNPLVQLVSYGAIFGFVYGGDAGVPRGLFVATLFCGLWPWWAFQEATMRGLTALVDQAPLLKKAPLPPEICILAPVLASFALQSIGFAIFLAIFAGLGLVPITPAMALLPVAMLLALAVAAGAALLLAPIYLVVRDTVHVATAALTLLFFASPVLYRMDALPQRLRPLAELNPIAGVIGLYRSAVVELALPPLASIASAVLAAGGGWLVGSFLLERLSGFLDEYW
jgi:lipopolysaccharide transport system permease protein